MVLKQHPLQKWNRCESERKYSRFSLRDIGNIPRLGLRGIGMVGQRVRLHVACIAVKKQWCKLSKRESWGKSPSQPNPLRCAHQNLPCGTMSNSFLRLCLRSIGAHTGKTREIIAASTAIISSRVRSTTLLASQSIQ